MTYGMLCHARGHPHSYPEKQRISLGVTIILGICLSSHTYLVCNLIKLVFIPVNTSKALLVVKILIKKTQSSSQTNQQPWILKAAATLISNHKSKIKRIAPSKKLTLEHRCTSKLLPQKMHFRVNFFYFKSSIFWIWAWNSIKRIKSHKKVFRISLN